MIVENHCLILHIFEMSDGETREEVAMDVMKHQSAEREAQRVQATARNWWSGSRGPCAKMGARSRSKGWTGQRFET
jgi:hypothetical protein